MNLNNKLYICIIVIFFNSCVCISIHWNMVNEEYKMVHTSPNGDTIFSSLAAFEYDEPILIDTNWYLPFWQGSANLNLLYQEANYIKTAPMGVLFRNIGTLQGDTIGIWINWNLNTNECFQGGYNEGFNVLIEKKIITNSRKKNQDTIYTFQTYNETYFLVKNKNGDINTFYINEKKDWNRYKRDSLVTISKPKYYYDDRCYFEVSKKRGVLSQSICKDTLIFSKGTFYVDNKNYQRFIQRQFPKIRTIPKPFFKKMNLLENYTTCSEDTIVSNIHSIIIDTNSIVIKNRHYFILHLNTKPISSPIRDEGATFSFYLPVDGFVRMENGKFWATGRMTYEMRFSKFKEYEQLIFDFKAKKGTTWQVQKHNLFGGIITYIGKRDKITYQYSIEPNESNGFPNLVGFEVNEDWGFTRFDFRNDDGEIVSYDMIKD